MRSHAYRGLGTALLLFVSQIANAGDCGCAPAPVCAPACPPPCQRCCHHHHCAPFIPQYIPGPVTAVIGTQTVPFAVVPTAQTVFPVQSVLQTQAVLPAQTVIASQAVLPAFSVGAQTLSAQSADSNAAAAQLLSQILKAQSANSANAQATAQAANDNAQLNQRLLKLERKVQALTDCLQKNLAD